MRNIMSKADTRRMLAHLEMAYPGDERRLIFDTPFQLLVSTMLVAHSSVEAVNAVTETLFQKYPTPEHIAALSAEEVFEEIRVLGMYRAKADQIVGAASRIVTWYRSEVPLTQEELVRLPGVGRKTANLVLAGLDIPALAVDAHLQRVANRIGLTNSMNQEITERQLCQKIPSRLWNQTQRTLFRLGKEVCKAKNPSCETCPVSDICQFYSLLEVDDKLRGKVFVEPIVT